MKRFIHPLLLLLAQATDKELVQTIEYFKTENRIPHNKLPKRINVTAAERAKLIKLGVRLPVKGIRKNIVGRDHAISLSFPRAAGSPRLGPGPGRSLRRPSPVSELTGHA
jgi:hypothetical protein